MASKSPNKTVRIGMQREIGRGVQTTEVSGINVATRYVSSLAVEVASSRADTGISGDKCPTIEVGRLTVLADRKLARLTVVEGLGNGHVGKLAVRARNYGQVGLRAQ